MVEMNICIGLNEHREPQTAVFVHLVKYGRSLKQMGYEGYLTYPDIISVEHPNELSSFLTCSFDVVRLVQDGSVEKFSPRYLWWSTLASAWVSIIYISGKVCASNAQ